MALAGPSGATPQPSMTISTSGLVGRLVDPDRASDGIRSSWPRLYPGSGRPGCAGPQHVVPLLVRFVSGPDSTGSFMSRSGCPSHAAHALTEAGSVGSPLPRAAAPARPRRAPALLLDRDDQRPRRRSGCTGAT